MHRLLTLAALLLACLLVLAACGRTADREEAPAEPEPAAEEDKAMELAAPSAVTFKSVSAGYQHTCGVRTENGTVDC